MMAIMTVVVTMVLDRVSCPQRPRFCFPQDYPKSLGSGAKVGFTSVDPWLCFSPCKNNTADAAKAQVCTTYAVHSGRCILSRPHDGMI